jgi:enoyl-CoA hydratase/carnithine racemase
MKPTLPKYCRTEREDKLLVVTLDRPDVLNSLNAPACFELEEIFNDFERDPSLWRGLVTEIAAPGQVMEVARRWADETLKCAPLAVRFTRELALEALEGEEFAALIGRRRLDVAARLFATEDTREGIRAFLEKREPVWRGC